MDESMGAGGTCSVTVTELMENACDVPVERVIIVQMFSIGDEIVYAPPQDKAIALLN
jgi:hypothetical protein